MPLNLPTLYHRCIYGQTIYRAHEEDREREESYAVDEHEDEEVDHSPDGRTEIGGEVSVGPYYEYADEEVVG